jgi:hypothetical protein
MRLLPWAGLPSGPRRQPWARRSPPWAPRPWRPAAQGEPRDEAVCLTYLDNGCVGRGGGGNREVSRRGRSRIFGLGPASRSARIVGQNERRRTPRQPQQRGGPPPRSSPQRATCPGGSSSPSSACAKESRQTRGQSPAIYARGEDVAEAGREPAANFGLVLLLLLLGLLGLGRGDL